MPPQGSPHFGRLYNVLPVMDRVVGAYKVHYKPQKHLSIDESMVGSVQGEIGIDTTYAKET